MKIIRIISCILAGTIAFSTLVSLSLFDASATDSSSRREIELPPIVDNQDVVKYQLAGSATKIRFIWIVSEETLEAANSGTCRLLTSPTPEADWDFDQTNSITKAYHSIYADGVKTTAPTGYVFVVSDAIMGLTSTTMAAAYFTLDNMTDQVFRVYPNII